MTDSTQNALVAHLHDRVERAEQHAANLTNQLTQYKDFVAALKSAARHDAPITPAFIHAQLDGYGLTD